MADSKREASFQDEVATSKKSKITDTDAESIEKERKCLDSYASETIKVVATESNEQNESSSQQEISSEGTKNSPSEVNNSSEVTNSFKSVVVGQEGSKLSSIEADAAEDRGSRHTMEDAWVVLPDASLEYAGKLRCSLPRPLLLILDAYFLKLSHII